MKKFLIILIILIVAGGLWASLGRGTRIKQSAEQSVGNGNTEFVTVTDSGYSPNTLTIKAGTTVTFKNESGIAIWPASDPHPIHTDYPEFDARRPYEQGASYSFTFERKGQWKYHDHLSPNRRGLIIVE